MSTEKKDVILGYMTLNGKLEDFEILQDQQKIYYGLFTTKDLKTIKEPHVIGLFAPTTADCVDAVKEQEPDKRPDSVLLIRVKMELVTELHKDISY